MSATRPQFSIDDAFELTLEDAGPGPESSGVARFGPLHFERRARFEVADEDKQSRLRYQNLENDEDGAQASPEPDGGVSTRDSGHTSMRSSQWSFSTISSTTQRSYNACCSWTQHPLIQKNRRVVLASFLLLLLGLVLILVGVGLEVAPSPGVSSAIFFVPGALLLVPGVYHVIFIYCAVKGHRGFQFFYLPYFEKADLQPAPTSVPFTWKEKALWDPHDHQPSLDLLRKFGARPSPLTSTAVFYKGLVKDSAGAVEDHQLLPASRTTW